MFDLSALKTAKVKSENNYQKARVSFEEEYKSALELIRDFSVTRNSDLLKKAGEKLFNALKIKRLSVEPYVYLSYIFYVFDDLSTAKEYLEIAEKIDPAFNRIALMKNVLYSQE